MDTNTTTIAPLQASNEQLLVFSQAKEEYALRLTEIREIVKVPDVTAVPNMPSSVVGVVNFGELW